MCLAMHLRTASGSVKTGMRCACHPTYQTKHFLEITPTISSLRIYPSHHFLCVYCLQMVSHYITILTSNSKAQASFGLSLLGTWNHAGIHDCPWPLLRFKKNNWECTKFDPCTREVEAGQSERIQAQPWLYNEFKNSLEYMGTCCQKKLINMTKYI